MGTRQISISKHLTATAQRQVSGTRVDIFYWQGQCAAGHQADGLVGARAQGGDRQSIGIDHTDGAATSFAVRCERDRVEMVVVIGQRNVTIAGDHEGTGTADRRRARLGDRAAGHHRQVSARSSCANTAAGTIITIQS